jgi:hypothetical protein
MEVVQDQIATIERVSRLFEQTTGPVFGIPVWLIGYL